jgi:hypothetical protein
MRRDGATPSVLLNQHTNLRETGYTTVLLVPVLSVQQEQELSR